jgi:hypothetical protein
MIEFRILRFVKTTFQENCDGIGLRDLGYTTI